MALEAPEGRGHSYVLKKRIRPQASRGEPAKAEQARKAAQFPIVGIGASAGGLAAFEAFFSSLPTDRTTGMAFVLVQHLAPDHKSILSELIQHYTRLEVHELTDGLAGSSLYEAVKPPPPESVNMVLPSRPADVSNVLRRRSSMVRYSRFAIPLQSLDTQTLTYGAEATHSAIIAYPARRPEATA